MIVEKLQKRATRFFLLEPHLITNLGCWLELQDIVLTPKLLKYPPADFNLAEYVTQSHCTPPLDHYFPYSCLTS